MDNDGHGVNLSNDKLLAIEVVGDTFKLYIPEDALLTEHMLEELIHQVKMKQINQAYGLRKAMTGNGVQKAGPVDIARFGRHRRS